MGKTAADPAETAKAMMPPLALFVACMLGGFGLRGTLPGEPAPGALGQLLAITPGVLFALSCVGVLWGGFALSRSRNERAPASPGAGVRR